MHASVHYMQALNVSTVEDWAKAARARGTLATAEEIERRRKASDQMRAIMEGSGTPVLEDVLADQELLVMGYMTAEEYRAYLEAKYQGAEAG